jgi:hypothetical protein
LPTFQRSTLPRSHVQRSTLPRSHVQRSTFNAPTFPRSTFNLQRSTFNVQPSTFNLQRSTFNVQRSHVLTFPRSTFNVRNSSAAWRSAIEIASGRLFAGRPPAWTLPRRPHRRSPGAKRPLRRGFNRTPEQLPTFQRSTLPRSNLQRSTFNLQPSTFHLQRSTFNAPTFSRSHVQRSTFVTPQLPGVQRLKSPLEGFSPGVHLRGRCHGDRIGGRPARSVLSGAVSTARLSSCQHSTTFPRSTFNVRNSSAAWRSAIEIASGRLFAGRPPAWTLPRRPHRRSPGAKRPLRRGFNRTPEQLPTFQRSTLPRSHVPTFPRSTNAPTFPRSTFNVQRSTFQPSTFNVPTFHLQRSTFNAPTFSRSHVQRSTFVTPQLPGVQRLKSPLEGFSPGVHLRGRCHGDRIGGRPARSVLSGAVSTARLSSCQHFNVQRSHVPTFNVQRSTFNLQRSTFNVQRSTLPRSTFNVRNSSATWRSAIEIASGRLFAGRPPAWTLPRRPHRRSPGAKRPLRRGFNRTPEQLPTFQRSTFPRSTFNVRNSSAAWRSAIEIASGRLFAGRPPAWTLPRRPHRRSPGAKRPLRCGFNRTPEQLPTFQRSTLPRSHVQRSTLPRSHVPPSTFNVQRSNLQPSTFPRSTFNVQRSNLQRSTFNVQPSTFHLQRSTFQPSTFNVQRSTFNLQRSIFNVQPSTLTAAPAPHVPPDTA